jgi:hypothetical protein
LLRVRCRLQTGTSETGHPMTSYEADSYMEHSLTHDPMPTEVEVKHRQFPVVCSAETRRLLDATAINFRGAEVFTQPKASGAT